MGQFATIFPATGGGVSVVATETWTFVTVASWGEQVR